MFLRKTPFYNGWDGVCCRPRQTTPNDSLFHANLLLTLKVITYWVRTPPCRTSSLHPVVWILIWVYIVPKTEEEEVWSGIRGTYSVSSKVFHGSSVKYTNRGSSFSIGKSQNRNTITPVTGDLRKPYRVVDGRRTVRKSNRVSSVDIKVLVEGLQRR